MTLKTIVVTGAKAPARRARGFALGSFCVILYLTLGTAPGVASSAPMVARPSAAIVIEHRATLQAEINPEGLETEYTIWLEYCYSPFGGGSCESTAVVPIGSGRVAAGSGEVGVSAEARELVDGRTYTSFVVAVNGAGSTQSASVEFTPYEGGGQILQTEGQQIAIPENKGTPYEPHPESWTAATNETAQRALAAAEQEARERAERARLESPQYKEEQERREVQEREARAQAEEAAHRAAPRSVRCRVPEIVGESLAAAHATLRRSGCSLGKITRRHGHGRPVVLSQSHSHGTKLARGAAVNVVVGARRGAKS